MKIKFTPAVLAALVAIGFLSISACAQGIGTTEYYMRYGREYFEARKYDMAIMYFEDAVRKDPSHAEANYLIGMSYIKLGKPEKARPFMEKAAELDPKFRQKDNAAAGQSDTVSPPRNRVADETSETARGDDDAREFEVGDPVEVSYAGQWNSGTIISVQGRGESVRAEVEFSFQGDMRTAKFSYNALRHAPAKPKAASNAGHKIAGGGLTLGEYGCSSKIRSGSQWVFTPRGTFRLQPNGSYTQTNGGGKYRYDSGAKTIVFSGGFFGNSTAKGQVISSSQIDITFSPSYWWTCALQK